MAKPSLKIEPAHAPERLPWPQHEKDLPAKPRTFRIHRLSAYEWQAYVIEGTKETPIGKPDLFDIVKTKVSGVMRAEGQRDFIESKKLKNA